jgi:hypothetical protein
MGVENRHQKSSLQHFSVIQGTKYHQCMTENFLCENECCVKYCAILFGNYYCLHLAACLIAAAAAAATALTPAAEPSALSGRGGRRTSGAAALPRKPLSACSAAAGRDGWALAVDEGKAEEGWMAEVRMPDMGRATVGIGAAAAKVAIALLRGARCAAAALMAARIGVMADDGVDEGTGGEASNAALNPASEPGPPPAPPPAAALTLATPASSLPDAERGSSEPRAAQIDVGAAAAAATAEDGRAGEPPTPALAMRVDAADEGRVALAEMRK